MHEQVAGAAPDGSGDLAIAKVELGGGDGGFVHLRYHLVAVGGGMQAIGGDSGFQHSLVVY